MSNFAIYKSVAYLIGIAMLLISSLPVAHAANISGRFNVTVNQNNGKPVIKNSAFCKRTNDAGAFGATVTVVCATGAVVDIAPSNTGQPFSPTHGGAYRYLFQAVRGGDLLGTVDTYVGAGNITSWRVVNLRDRDYVEMLVNW